MRDLDGEWNVRRVSGVLPPLYGVRKRIDGLKGVTLPPLPVPLPFDVAGRELRYRGLLSGLVDHLEPDGDGWRGVARYRGRTLGRFAMTALDPQRSQGLSSRSISRQPRGESSRARTVRSSTTTRVGNPSTRKRSTRSGRSPSSTTRTRKVLWFRRRCSTWARNPSTRRHCPESDDVKKISRGRVALAGRTGETVAMRSPSRARSDR